ncbi:hypothetical protein ACP8H2_17105 [Bacillus subtilis]|uniref:hypothetical protein n=1 Tax=Bacillus subtilis TaxID=1423 RepID=UPI003CF2F383
MKPKFAIGDIVAVDGYKDRIFYVDCWTNITITCVCTRRLGMRNIKRRLTV